MGQRLQGHTGKRKGIDKTHRIHGIRYIYLHFGWSFNGKLLGKYTVHPMGGGFGNAEIPKWL